MQSTPKSQGFAKQLSFRQREHTQKNVPGHCVFVPYAPWGGAKTLQSNGSENHHGHAWQLISNRVSIFPSHERTYIRTSPFLKIHLPQSSADTETFGSLYKSFMRLSCQKKKSVNSARVWSHSSTLHHSNTRHWFISFITDSLRMSLSNGAKLEAWERGREQVLWLRCGFLRLATLSFSRAPKVSRSVPLNSLSSRLFSYSVSLKC